MPLMNGISLCKNIKKTKICSKSPILFMTTQGKSSVENSTEINLFNGIINKPLNEMEFISAVKCLIQNSSPKIAL